MNSTSAPDAAAVEPSGINTLLGNDSRTFFINGKRFSLMVLQVYQKVKLTVYF